MKGFTLLELLLVVSILALVAGGALLAFEGTEEYAEESVLRSELATLRRALLAFRHDTGHLPKTGPFDLYLPSAGRTGRINPSVGDDWPDWLPAGVDRVEWFDSPANLYQLLTPRDAAWIENVMEAEPGTGRGYFGPYLERSGERFVYVGAGDPATGDPDLLVPGVADCYRCPNPVVSRRFLWQEDPLARADETDLEGLLNLGRPFLYLPQGAFGDALGPRILGTGPDGDAGFGSTPEALEARKDDMVAYLLELP